MLLVEHWIRPSWPAIIILRIQGRLSGRLARRISQLRLTPPAEARMKAADLSSVSTDEMTSRWASALCLARLTISLEASAISLERVTSSERTRSSISGATRITASKASRARMPRTCLSFTVLRLKLMRDILAPFPGGRKIGARVQKDFPELGKIGPNPVNLRMPARHG